MALYGRDLLSPFNGHLDGTAGGAGLTNTGLCAGKPKRRSPDIRRPAKLNQ
jgi:hypothetical protein